MGSLCALSAQGPLHTVPMGWADWGLIFVVTVPIFIMAETYKLLRRQRMQHKSSGLAGVKL